MKIDVKNNSAALIQGGIILVLVIANIIGGVYCYSVFTSITTTSTQIATPIASQLISPLNTTLYSQIEQNRQTRDLYTSNSSAPSYSSVNEIFGN